MEKVYSIVTAVKLTISCFKLAKTIQYFAVNLNLTLYISALFLCEDGLQSVPSDYICNGVGNCDDNSDEDKTWAGCEGNDMNDSSS